MSSGQNDEVRRLLAKGWVGQELEGYRRTLEADHWGGNPHPGSETVQVLTPNPGGKKGEWDWKLWQEEPAEIELESDIDMDDPEAMRTESAGHYDDLESALKEAEEWRGNLIISRKRL